MREPVSKLRPDLKKRSVKSLNRQLNRDNKAYSLTLAIIPKDQWPPNTPERIVEMWRSCGFLMQIYSEDNGIERLSICRTRLKNDGHYDDNISWDEIQRLKHECGRGDKHAVEIYPSDDDIVNSANMRHLWVLPDRLPFAWRKT